MKHGKLLTSLLDILQMMEDQESSIDVVAKKVHAHYQPSAKNLLRYLILRGFDLRKYHDVLSDIGVSSLRSAEGYTYSNLFNVVKNLCVLHDHPFDRVPNAELIGYKRSKKLMRKHARKLFKGKSKKHFTEIMVTLPLEAADDPAIIREMAHSGMEIARINLSHGDLPVWKRMVDTIEEVNREGDVEVKIYMDLAGPKIRTSDIRIVNAKGKEKSGIPIRNGEHIILTKEVTTGKSSVFGPKGEQIEKAEIGVMLPEIIKDVKIGDRVLFDDGMIQGLVVDKGSDHVEVALINCYKSKLSSQKGINLPNTKLNLPALTQSDLENLPFVAAHADMVGYSFVRTSEDVQFLYAQLEKHNAQSVGVVFKIENQEAFENLPSILLAGMQHNNIGVMIARGDLAVEIGFERISEVQSQILWICEAAHVPVIWATQVLENLAKSGIPTRAEISDAAQGAYAECVMLNKGPYINEAIRTLKNVLTRMEAHAFKKKGSMRALKIAKRATKQLL